MLSRLVVAAFAFLLIAHEAVSHPLDPLSADEIRDTVSVLRDAGLTNTDTLYALIDLAEPPKAEVLAWHPGALAGRAAFVVARQNRTVYEGVVDLRTNRVARWQAIAGLQPGIVLAEWETAQRVTMADPGWQEAMRERGYTAFDKLFCAPFTVGPTADPREAGSRLLNVTRSEERRVGKECVP